VIWKDRVENIFNVTVPDFFLKHKNSKKPFRIGKNPDWVLQR